MRSKDKQKWLSGRWFLRVGVENGFGFSKWQCFFWAVLPERSFILATAYFYTKNTGVYSVYNSKVTHNTISDIKECNGLRNCD